MPTKSSYPDIDIPNVGLWDFLFEREGRDFPDDKAIFIDPATNRSYSFAQTKQTAIDFGKGLKGLWDFQKGEVLALYSPNCIDTPAVTWGIHWAGGVVSPANPGYTIDELAYQLKDSKATGLITQLAQLDQAKAAANKVGIPEERIILIGDEKDPAGRFKHFSSVRNISGTQRYRRAKVDPDNDLSFLVYSSGTTGLPKGVMLSHRNIVANVLQITAGEPHPSWKPAEGRPDGDAILAFLPFFHIYGLTALIHQCFYRGFKCVVMPKFEIEAWCRIVQDHKITMSYVVPPVVLLLTKHPIVEKYDLSSLRMLNSGAAPLTRDLVEATYKRIKVPIKQAYGLSETSPGTHSQTWETWQTGIGSVGLLLPNITAKFMSPEEKEVPRGEVGELWVSGPNIFKGYLNNVEGTKNALTEDGYFKTGDVGYEDKDGNFFITGKYHMPVVIYPPANEPKQIESKSLSSTKAFRQVVAPAELEGYLVAHDKIDDVAVLGVFKEALATEVPLAYVVLRKGVDASPSVKKEIVNWLNAKVSNHKKLRGGVKFTNEIPKSVSGKILRRMLKVKYQEEEAAAAKKAKL